MRGMISMVVGLTMIKAVPGCERMLYKSLKGIGASRVLHIFGEYDFFVILEADDLFGIKMVVEDIREMDYVAMVRPILVSEIFQHGGYRATDRGPKTSYQSALGIAC